MATQSRIGWRPYVTQVVSAVDADTTAFIAAAGITDLTQASAISTLVTDLKAYGLWTKMKAIYPFVGGSAASHKFNLKDPRDLDAAYRLVFNGGWTHTSNGAKPNGTTGYANTYLVPNSVFNVTDLAAAGYYSRTAAVNVTRDYVLGAYTVGKGSFSMVIKRSNDNFYTQAGIDFPSGTTYRQLELSPNPYTGDGLYHFSQQGTAFKYWRNTTLIGQNGVVSSNLQQSTHPIFLGTYNNNGTPASDWTDKEAAFSYFSTKLTDSEATNLYTTIQKFQTTLGRHVGTPYVSDPDAIAFLMAAGIKDGTQAAAINTLVIRMKADGVWTKMKAIYPFVGGTATSHKWNLKDPRDLDAAYRLVFNGGWTHTSTGALPNGTTGYADTKIVPINVLTNNNYHLSHYSRTQIITGSQVDFGLSSDWDRMIGIGHYYQGTGKFFVSGNNGSLNSSLTTLTAVNNTNTLGLLVGTRTSQTIAKLFANNVQQGSTLTMSNSSYLPSNASGGYLLISANRGGSVVEFSSKEVSFASTGDGLTDTETSALYTAVQAYQTTLGRQVNIPLVSDADAQAFLNAANITSFQQASAVNKLVVDLKAAGVWTKMKAIYPFVGGSAASHKFNLKDPRDLNAAYRLVFNGGWTHTSTGALPNGTTGYAETFFSPSSNFISSDNAHISVYQSMPMTLSDMGGSFNSTSRTLFGANTTFIDCRLNSNETPVYVLSYNSDGKGLFTTTKNGSAQVRAYRNNALAGTVATQNAANPLNMFISARNGNGTPNEYESTIQKFISFGDGLTDADAASLYNAVQAYQTSLGRHINTPVYNSNLVLSLDAGSANSYPGTGTTWFDLAAGNNGTLVNGPTYDVNNGGSLYFDGTNDHGNFGNVQSLNSLTSGVTVGAWIKSSTTTTYSAILQKWYQAGVQGGFQLYISPGGVLSLAIGDYISSYGGCNSTVSVITGSWIYVTATYDMNSMKIYINGVLNSTNSFVRSVVNSNNATLYVGQDDYGGRFFRGNISSATVYNRALSATEILNNFNSTRGRFGL